ncbi:MAG: ABC transporter permease [Magnetococcales bacterium]|nr:ABC transporter permease [Magnetococcales bacterium]
MTRIPRLAELFSSGARSGNRPASRRDEEPNGRPPSAMQSEGRGPGWNNFHLRAIQRAWRPFADKSLSHWTTLIVIALALTIHGAFSLLLVNANTALNQWEEENLVTVFMQRSVEREQMVQIGKKIKSHPSVADLTIIAPKEAVTRLKKMMGEGAGLLDELDENPLPYSMEFRLSKSDRSLAVTLAREIEAMPGVESVSYDHQWAERLSAVIRVIRYVGNVMSFLLLAAVALIVSNTIKLTIIARRDEVEIMRFLGADDAFIKAPFIYEGLLQGILGAGGALVLTALLHFGVRNAVMELGRTFGTTIQWEFLPLTQLGVLVGLGAILGLSGALLSVSRFLDG